MDSSSNLLCWQFIFAKPYDQLADLIQIIAKRCDRLIVNEEGPEGSAAHGMDCNRVHCHMMVVNPSIGLESMRRAIPKEYKGNGDYRLLTVTHNGHLPYDYDKLGKYVLKGNEKCVQFVKNISPEEVKKWAEMWVIHTEQDPESSAKCKIQSTLDDTVEKKVKTKWEMMHVMREKMKSRKVYIEDYEAIITIVREVLYDNKQVIGLYKIQDYVDSIQFYDNSNFSANLAIKLRQRYNP